MNKYVSLKSDAALICKNCMGAPARIGKSVLAFKISYVCRCGELVRAENNSNEISAQKGIPALKDENGIICPVCSSLLFEVDTKSIRGFSFRVKCGCGGVFERERALQRRLRKIGTYASINDVQNKQGKDR